MENMVREPAVKYNWVSPGDYLAAERTSEVRHEYFGGEVMVMQGASLKHEDIITNLIGGIHLKLKGKNCRVRPSNLRVASPFFHCFTYPDATIVCGEPQLSDDNFDVLQNPTVIFEVVSKWSEGRDYSHKLMYYRQIPSLREYVLINAYKKVLVDVFRRNPDNTWTLETLADLGQTLVLHSTNISIALADIYENVSFEPLVEGEGLLT